MNASAMPCRSPHPRSAGRSRRVAPLVVVLAGLAVAAHGADVERFDVIWTTPSAGVGGTMPAGNGDVSVNAWVEADGDLRFYVGKTDSWDEHGRLLKVGRIRIALDPPLPCAPFLQRLDLRDGVVRVRGGAGADAVDLSLWVDATQPIVRVEIDGATPRTAIAVLEPWRTERTAIPEATTSDTFEERGRPGNLRRPVFVDPDVLLPDGADRIGWFHHARAGSDFAELIEVQGIADAFAGRPDPLVDRVFGAVVTAARGERVDDRTLRSPAARTHRFDVHVRADHPSTPAAWRSAIDAQIEASARIGLDQARAAHRAWWHAFWERSWIDVTMRDPAPPRLVPETVLSLRLGVDRQGGNRLAGALGTVTVVTGTVDDETIAAWAARGPDAPGAAPAGAIVHQRGEIGAAVEPAPVTDTARGLVVAAWVRPAPGPPRSARLVDRITPGGADGWLIDLHPGRRPRFIVGRHVLEADAEIPADAWSHVAGVADPERGRLVLLVNGRRVAEAIVDAADDALVVSRGYALQRYLTACAGRGRFPIKFNGSIFTVPHEGAWGDADYRRWGPGYWWQNTRLPYLGLCASGDFEMLEPLFRMYVDEHGPLNRLRTRRHAGHGGLFVPECVTFWGGSFPESYGWTPYAERGEDKLQESPWHKREWVAGLELAWMMLDLHDHRPDPALLERRVLPFATEVLRFFDERFALDDDGRYRMEPTQALETWWDTTNPMPEVAGLTAVAARLLALPADAGTPAQRALWRRVAERTPALPLREVDGVRMLAPAQRFDAKRNVENPELYAVFPFRLVTFAGPDADLGRAALAHRWDRGAEGWRQDDLFMTHLGLAEAARANLVARARNRHAGSRFPAFWGPNYDWVPDQTHGGVLMRTLQTMLLQADGRALHLMPAWPAEWDATFRLHAPHATVLTGRIAGGRLVELDVQPPERRADVVVHGP